MGAKIGILDMDGIYLGTTKIDAVYLGTDLTYTSGPFVGLRITPGSYTFNDRNLTHSFRVKSSEPWEISSIPTWLTADIVSGDTGDTIITLTATSQTADTTDTLVITSSTYSATTDVSWSVYHDYALDYLTFKIGTDGTISWGGNDNLRYDEFKTIYCSVNDGNWVELSGNTTNRIVSINVTAGDIVRFKGENQYYAYEYNRYNRFGGTAEFEVYGNINSLVVGDNFAGANPSYGNRSSFTCLFFQTQVTNAENLILPKLQFTTSDGNSTYQSMFNGCTLLTKAPVLPATSITNYSYTAMFSGCSSLSYIKCMVQGTPRTSTQVNFMTSGVAASGTFVCATNSTWSTGVNGIPSGWTVVRE